MKSKKSMTTTILLVLLMLIGLSLLLYPSVSDYWNKSVQSYAVENYIQDIADMEIEEYKEVWQAAIDYNKTLIDRQNQYTLTKEQKSLYDSLLNVSGTGIMAYVEIPSINVRLPIYHGTSEPVLQVAIGHLDWTSLPTGGEGTHCVVSGHRGLPSARLFSDLDELVVGDVFMLHVLDEVLTYEVDQILIVLPEEVETLLIDEGKDLCTLFTCTPYGINSHRLLVRGHRIENLEEARPVYVTADAIQIRPPVVAAVIGLPMLLIIFVVIMVCPNNSKEKRRR